MQTLYNRDLLTISDLGHDQIKFILKMAKIIKTSTAIPPLLKNKIIAHCFFEPSTRTRLSFTAATLRLGGQIIGLSEQGSSQQKGEDFHDTMQMISHYCDAIVLRHPQAGAAAIAAELSDKPVINAGDGDNQHPTQTLLDLFSIQECQADLNNLKIALAGDLKYSRTIHSLCEAISLFQVELFLIPTSGLDLPNHYYQLLADRKVPFSTHEKLQSVLNQLDILYISRLQRERFTSIEQSNLVASSVLISAGMLKQAKHNLKILHPLPRLNEIDKAIDKTPFAYYFQQAENGLYIRQALLALLFHKEIPNA